MPKVSVLMSVYNGERYLPEAIESILNQTFSNFEFIIVDDGSTDSTQAVVRQFADERIVFLRQEHAGLAAALNQGIEIARGEFIARQDADDHSLPTRLEQQVAFLDRSAEVDVLGCWGAFVDMEGHAFGTLRVSNTPEAIRSALSRGDTPFCHGSVMMRRAVLQREGGYDESYPVSQDFELWHRFLARGVRMAVLEEELYQYRLTPSNCEANPTSHRQVEATTRVLAAYGQTSKGPASPPHAGAEDLLGRYYLHVGKIALNQGGRGVSARYFWRALGGKGVGVRLDALVGLGCAGLPRWGFHWLTRIRSALRGEE